MLTDEWRILYSPGLRRIITLSRSIENIYLQQQHQLLP